MTSMISNHWGVLKRVVNEKEQVDLQLQSIPNVILLYDDKNYVGTTTTTTTTISTIPITIITTTTITTTIIIITNNNNLIRTLSKSRSYQRLYSFITMLFTSSFP